MAEERNIENNSIEFTSKQLRTLFSNIVCIIAGESIIEEDDLADSIKQLLQCSVCLQRFEDPKCLPCLHTFCNTLVLNENKIKCPECRVLHTLSPDGVSGLTSNFTMVSLMDISIKLAQRACADCDAETIESDLTPCPHCGDVICPVCSVSHFTNMKASLYKSAQSIHNDVAHIYDAKHKLEADLLQLTRESDDFKTEISKNVDRFIHELRDREESLCQQVDAYVSKASSSLQSEMTLLEAELANRLSLSASIDTAILKLHDNIEADIETLMSISAQCTEYIDQDDKNRPSSLQNRTDHSVSFVSINAEELSESILNFGEIITDTQDIGDRTTGIDMEVTPKTPYHERQGMVILDENDSNGFSMLRCIAVSPSGDRIYVTVKNTVQMFDGHGRHIKTSHGPADEVAGFFFPVGIAVNKNGGVIVSDRHKHRVVVFDRDLEYRFSFGRYGGNDGQFDKPTGLAVDDTCTIYVCDLLNYRIQVFDHTGIYLRKITQTASLQGVFSPTCLAIGRGTGSIYVTDSKNHRVQVYSIEGQYITHFTTARSDTRKSGYPLGICVDDDGHVIVSDHYVNVFQADGTFQCTLDSENTPNTLILRPYGLTMDNAGRLLVVDSGNKKVIAF